MREMRDSGIPWIGEIPKDWRNAKYRYSGEFIKGKLPNEQNVEQLGKPIIGASEMLGKECRNFSTDENVPTCQKEDVLILWDGANAGIVANNCEGIVSSTAVKYVCTDKKFDAQFLFYLFKNGEPFFKSKVNGTTIPHMNQKYIDEYLCIQPSLAEQQRIAEFLDRKCAEVDETIALQEQIIEELKAYKQSVITEAVTKGLNPAAPMRDSGIKWIGQIPEHWEVCRGRHVLVFQKRPVRDNDEVVTCFRDGEVILRSLRRTEGFTMSDKEIGYQGINEGDIVIHGMDGFAGAMGVSKSTGKGSPVLVVCSPKYDAVPQFIVYYLRALAIMDVFVSLATGIRERSCDLRWNKISELPFILPSSTEQQAIADYLDEKCADIDSLIQTKQSKIDSLKEYKKSIIYEYVTGKREVE